MEKHILTALSKNDSSVFKEQALRHLPRLIKYGKKISAQQQQQVVHSLKNNSAADQFFFTVDTQTYSIKEKYDIQKWLGYDEEEFTISKYVSSLHPTQLPTRNLFYYHWMERLLAGDFRIEFMKHRFSMLLSLKRRDGNYIYVKQTVFVFQHDGQHRLLEYLNHFTVLHYRHENLYRTHFNGENGNRLHHWESQVNRAVREDFLYCGLFSDMQVKILKHINAHAGEEYNLKHIACGLHEDEANIKTQTFRIKNKINDFFNTTFTESRLAILFLSSQGLLLFYNVLTRLPFFQYWVDSVDLLTDNLEDLCELVKVG